MTSHAPLILIEIVLVFGGVLLFTVWQLRSVKRDQARTRAEDAAREAAAATPAPSGTTAAAERANAASSPAPAHTAAPPPPADQR